jgi:hypothetical protein
MSEWYPTGEPRVGLKFIHELLADLLPFKGMRLVDPKKQARIVHSNDPSATIRKGEPVKERSNRVLYGSIFNVRDCVR